jgi:hypothetical protein
LSQTFSENRSKSPKRTLTPKKNLNKSLKREKEKAASITPSEELVQILKRRGFQFSDL